jgi:hypothetical protein
VAWSHQLLEETERLVFDRLSVFAGGFTLEAAMAVCAGDSNDAVDAVDELDVEDAVFGLVDRSIVLAEPSADGIRYRLLETLRQFGETQLLDNNMIDAVRLRHAHWFADFAQMAAECSRGVDGIEWNRRLLAEVDNYRTAIYGPDVAAARRIVANIGFASIFSQNYEYIDWALEILDPPAPEDHDWIGCAVLAVWATQYVGRSEDRTQIRALVDPDAIPPGVLSFWWLKSHASDALDSGGNAIKFLEPMLQIATAIDDDFHRLICSGQVSLVGVFAGELDLASTVWEELADDPARSTLPLADALIAYYHGGYLAAVGDPQALGQLEHSHRISVECGWSMVEQVAGSAQVSLLIEKGDLPAARHRMIESVNGHIRAGDHLTLWMTLHQLVRLLAEIGQHDHAAEVWAELTNRAGWTGPSLRADLETRLGPPAEPNSAMTNSSTESPA